MFGEVVITKVDFVTHISKKLNVPEDQVRFLVTCFASIVLGVFYRFALHKASISRDVRHFFQIFVGLFLCYFLYGRHSMMALIHALIGYLMLTWFEVGKREKLVLYSSISFLSIFHLYNYFFHHNMYLLDITGTIMLNTEKITSLAFGLKDYHDKKYKNKNLPPKLEEKIVDSFPSFIQYMSFMFSFQCLILSPVCFYSDYIIFIEGLSNKNNNNNNNKIIKQKENNNNNNYHVNNNNNNEIKKRQEVINNNNNNNINNGFHDKNRLPSNGYDQYEEKKLMKKWEKDENEEKMETENKNPLPLFPTNLFIEKIVEILFFGCCFFFLLPLFPQSFITEPSFKNKNFFIKIFYIWIWTLLRRTKYYFAFKLGEAICLSAGLGYNGKDEKGMDKWDLCLNVNIFQLETSTSFKSMVENWNISTNIWLRYIIYERNKSVFMVNLFSALWHGFYPGYYLTFITGGILIYSARTIRRKIRPFFIKSSNLKKLYDLLTLTFSQLALSYMAFPFVLLNLQKALSVYNEIYFYLHLFCLLVAIIKYFLPLSNPYNNSCHDNNKNINNNVNNNININNNKNIINNINNNINNNTDLSNQPNNQ